MNTKLVWGIVAVVVVLGGGAYLLSQSGGSSQPAAVEQSQGQAATSSQTAQPQTGSYQGSLADLARRGGDWKCTVNVGTAAAVSSGVVHVSGQKVRADFTSNVSGAGTIDSHMISDGSYYYTWTSAYPQGFKMAIPASDTPVSPTNGSAQTSSSGLNPDQNYSYDCQAETPDASLFVPPSNITFTTMPSQAGR